MGAVASVRFVVVVTAPDGYTSPIATAPIDVVSGPISATATMLGATSYACVRDETTQVPVTLGSAETLDASFATGNSVAAAVASITGTGLTATAAPNFTAIGALTLAVTATTGA